MKWRVIKLETRDAFMNMGLDEAASEAVGSKKAPPTIRFYRWKPSAVSIGYFQSLEEEVSLKRCVELGVDRVRRRTGGGAVYHDYEGEITYSVIAPEELLPGDITKSYAVICGWICNGLKSLGLNASFKAINDIIVKGKKISGNAQTRRGGVLLQHGTILYDLDIRTMFDVLKVGEEKISDKMIKAVEERVTCIKNHTEVKRRDVVDALIESFTAGKEHGTEEWSREELSRAKELAESRYRKKEWNFMR